MGGRATINGSLMVMIMKTIDNRQSIYENDYRQWLTLQPGLATLPKMTGATQSSWTTVSVVTKGFS